MNRRQRRGPVESHYSSGLGEVMAYLFVKAVIAFVLGTVIIAVVAACGHHIEYWAAYLIAFVLTFGGWLVIDGDWFD